MLFLDSISDFMAFARYERKMTIATTRTYGPKLNSFARFAAARTGIELCVLTLEKAFTREVLRDYIRAENARNLAGSTVRKVLAVFRSYGEYQLAEGRIGENYALSLTRPKKNAPKRDTISDAEVARMMQAIHAIKDAKERAFTHAIFATVIYSGLRISELAALKISHIDMHAQTITIVCGKGGKARIVKPAWSEYYPILAAWLGERAKMRVENDWLWPADVRRKHKTEYIRAKIKALYEKAGIVDGRKLCVHTLRHNFAMHLYKAGGNINQVKAALGHSDARTTLAYLRPEDDDIDAMAVFGSRAPVPALSIEDLTAQIGALQAALQAAQFVPRAPEALQKTTKNTSESDPAPALSALKAPSAQRKRTYLDALPTLSQADSERRLVAG